MATNDKKPSNSTDKPFYSKTLDHVDERTRDVLENYSKVPADEVVPHVLKIRDEAWDVFPYPCIGQLRFLDLSLGQAPEYPEVLRRVKDGQRLLDTGCCFGQDIRRLVVDGAPSHGANLYGSDLKGEFFDLGYKLFRDRETLQASFLATDIFAPDSALSSLYGKVDIVHASAFLHLFEWDQQVHILNSVVKLLKPVKGSMILGRQMAHVDSGSFKGTTGNSLFRHNEESWRKLWHQIELETDTKWSVTFRWDDTEDWSKKSPKWQDPGSKPMRYAVWRE